MKEIMLILLSSLALTGCNSNVFLEQGSIGSTQEANIAENQEEVDPDIVQSQSYDPDNPDCYDPDNPACYDDSYGSPIDNNLDDDVVIIIEDDPVNEDDVDECDKQEQLPEGRACLVFKDSFERTNITGDNVFNWDVVVMDNKLNISNIDAKIEDSNHLGPVMDGDKAIMFRGRAGGSTHEIYLVSRKMDLQDYDKLYIQYRYVPIGLEIDPIFLSIAKVNVPESIRVDVCDAPDSDCGLVNSSDRLAGLRDHNTWIKYYNNTLERGEGLNIRNYVEQDWKLGQVVIDLNQYPERKAEFVFKITAAMDEGYFGNNHNNLMEDGIIFDDIAVLAVNGDCIIEDDEI